MTTPNPLQENTPEKRNLGTTLLAVLQLLHQVIGSLLGIFGRRSSDQ